MRSWFVGRAGINNDRNVLEVSPQAQYIVSGMFELYIDGGYHFVENGTKHTMLYQLEDGKCPDWAISAKTIHRPYTGDEWRYKKRKEDIRKDIERCFGGATIEAKDSTTREQAVGKEGGTGNQQCLRMVHNMIVSLLGKGD